MDAWQYWAYRLHPIAAKRTLDACLQLIKTIKRLKIYICHLCELTASSYFHLC